MFKQHPSWWQYLPQMLQMKNNSSSGKQMAQTKPNIKSLNKRAISEKGNRMGSKSGTILIEAKYQRVHKGRRKHHVVFHQRNQSKSTNTSRARYRSTAEQLKTKNNWPTTWWRAIDSGQTIWALQIKWGSHYPQRLTTIPEILRRKW